MQTCSAFSRQRAGCAGQLSCHPLFLCRAQPRTAIVDLQTDRCTDCTYGGLGAQESRDNEYLNAIFSSSLGIYFSDAARFCRR